MLYEKIKLEDDEKVLKRVRKHWFILFGELFGAVLAAILPPVFVLLAFGLPGDLTIQMHPSPGTFLLFGYITWLLLIWMVAWSMWTNYYLDIWTLTNKRLISVDQRGLFHRTTGSFRLERLQDLNVDVNGILATLLHFGTIEAQTAGGSEEEFRMSGLPHPRELKAEILRAADERLKRFEHSPVTPTGE